MKVHPAWFVIAAVSLVLALGVPKSAPPHVRLGGVVGGEPWTPPLPAERARLGGRAFQVPHHLRLSGRTPGLAVEASGALRAGWGGALGVRLTGEPGDTVRLVDASGDGPPRDTLSMVVGPDGVVSGGVRVAPTSPGWHSWELRRLDSGEGRRVRTWVLDDGAPRVRILSGPPTWESGFLVRALEESGVVVELRQALGDEVELRSSVEVGDADGFRPHAVVVLPGTPLGEGEWSELLVRSAEEGMGLVLLPEGPDGPVGTRVEQLLGEPVSPMTLLSAGALRWEAPPEVIPLPTVDLQVEVVAPRGDHPGTPLVAMPRGRGRVAVLGLVDSWRWRMEAGTVEPHRVFWRSLVEWSGGGAHLEGWRVPPPEVLQEGAPIPLVTLGLEFPGRLLPAGGDSLVFQLPRGRRLAAPLRSALPETAAGETAAAGGSAAEEGSGDAGFGEARLALALLAAPRGGVSGPEIQPAGFHPRGWTTLGRITPLFLLLLLCGVALGGWGWDRWRGRP